MVCALFTFLESAVGSFLLPVFFTVLTISFLVHVCLLSCLFIRRRYKVIPKKSWLCLLSVLISSMFVLLAWIFELARLLFIPTLGYNIVYFWICIAWAFTFIFYQSLALFIETLLCRQHRLFINQKIFIAISALFFSFFIFCAFLGCDNGYEFINVFNVSNFVSRVGIIYFIILMGITLLSTVKKLKMDLVPTIVKKQVTILISILIIPSLMCNCFQIFPLTVVSFASSLAIVSINAILHVCVLFFIVCKMVRLRFVSIKKCVLSSGNLSFIRNSRELTREFGFARHTYEFASITQELFEKVFDIPKRFTQLHIREHYQYEEPQEECKHIVSAVESLLDEKKSVGSFIMAREKILIYDEVERNHFYDQSIENKVLLKFLDSINADIFLPVYDDQKVVAYLIIERNARPNKSFGDVERNEMLVFGDFLVNFISSMNFESVFEVMYRRKRREEAFVLKQQETNQYRECLQVFLYSGEREKIGLISYENSRFTFGNQEAKEFIAIDLNLQVAHPLTKALKKIAQEVEQNKEEQRTIVKDVDRRRLVVSAVINQDGSGVIFVVYRPNISEVVSMQGDPFSDSDKSDYLLYLEATEAGRLVDHLIPGTGKRLLGFKVALLRAALSNKALLLDVPKADIRDTVDLVHRISSCEKIHVLSLTDRKKGKEDAIALFGINRTDKGSPQEEPLIKRLDKIGILFIENVHFLSREAQGRLAEFVSYGFFHTFGSEQPIMSDVRVICSTDQDLETCVEKGMFSKTLYRELKKTKLSMPPLVLLPEEEFKDLVRGFEDQVLSEPKYKNFLSLSDEDKEKCFCKRPTSLNTLREKVISLLEEKSKENCEETDATNEQKLAELPHLSNQPLKRSNNHEDVVEKGQK